MAEGENPTRRYKWFRPRQAQSGSGTPGGEPGLPACWLFNDSTGPSYLVVRYVDAIDLTLDLFLTFFQQKGNIPGGTASLIMPYVGDSPKLAGTVYTINDITATYPSTLGMEVNVPKGTLWQWPSMLPVAVIEPGWAWGLAGFTSSQSPLINFVWETIDPDELDFAW